MVRGLRNSGAACSGSDQATDQILGQVNDSGAAWLSGTTIGGRRTIRLSASNWQTSRRDIDRALAAFRAAVHRPADRPANRASG